MYIQPILASILAFSLSLLLIFSLALLNSNNDALTAWTIPDNN